MGQVPQLRYGLVGTGRMARHMAHYLSLLNLPYRAWSRHDALPVEEALRSCDVVLVLISDRAIEPFLREHPGLGDGRILVHFSGSLVTPLAVGMHPLMSFGEKLYDLETYRAVSFVGEIGNRPFEEIFPALPNRTFYIPARDHPLYHALCVLAGNDTVVLWQKFIRELATRWNIPLEAARPFLARVMSNVLEDPDHALTGPLPRGDEVTLRKNLEALSSDPFAPVFESVWNAYRTQKEISP